MPLDQRVAHAAGELEAEEGRVLALASEVFAADLELGNRIENADISRRTRRQAAGLDAKNARRVGSHAGQRRRQRPPQEG